jgi:two-component system chemotaxis sensor kinase CheA
MIVQLGGEHLIIPITSILEAIRPAPGQVSTVQGRGELIRVRNEHLSMVRLADYTKLAAQVCEPTQGIVIIVESDGRRCGILVDRLLGQQQVVIKSLGGRFKNVKGIAGGAVLGDGRIGLILDVTEVLISCRDLESELSNSR